LLSWVFSSALNEDVISCPAMAVVTAVVAVFKKSRRSMFPPNVLSEKPQNFVEPFDNLASVQVQRGRERGLYTHEKAVLLIS
jgi:hypothetical protein